MLVQQIAGGTVKWAQLPVYLAAELLAGVARRARVHALITADAPTTPPAPAIDLATPVAGAAASS